MSSPSSFRSGVSAATAMEDTGPKRICSNNRTRNGSEKLCDISLFSRSRGPLNPLPPHHHNASYTFQVWQQVALFFPGDIKKRSTHSYSRAHDLILSLKMYCESCEMPSCHFIAQLFLFVSSLTSLVPFRFVFIKIVIEMRHAVTRPPGRLRRNTKVS